MLTQCNAEGDVECSECGRVYAATELVGNSRCPADDCPSNEKIRNLDANWKWFCRACGGSEDECECNADNFGAEFNDGVDDEAFGHDGFQAQDPYDCEYDR